MMTNNAVIKTHQLFDEKDQTWRDIYEAPGLEGSPIKAEVPREDQAPGSVRRHLLRNGVTKSAVEDEHMLAAAIDTSAPVVRRAALPGWRDGNQCFVSHRHVTGRSAGSEVLPPISSLSNSDRMGERGTLDSWKELIDSAKYSTTMIVVLCAVFAAALLALVNRQSFAICLYAVAKCGKSLAQLLAGSALGFGREQDLPGLNGTEAGLLACFKSNNDHITLVNEVGTASRPKNSIYDVLHQTTYATASGQDRIRHPSWGNSTGEANSFRTISVFSTEISPDEWAARNGQSRDPGEMARMIGLPVLYEGMRTVFDRIPEKLSDDEFREWEQAQILKLYKGLPENRGTAFPAYLDALLEDVTGYTDRANELIDSFARSLAYRGMSPVAQDVIAKFGVLYAGGVIAYETEVVDFDEPTIFRAIRDGCRDALGAIPDPEAELWKSVKLFRDRLKSGSLLDVTELTRKKQELLRHADGYQRKQNTGCQVVIRAQSFYSWFGSQLQLRQVLEWLDDEGFLDHHRQRTPGRSNDWAQKHVLWPNEARVRSVSIYLPSGLADLERNG